MKDRKHVTAHMNTSEKQSQVVPTACVSRRIMVRAGFGLCSSLALLGTQSLSVFAAPFSNAIDQKGKLLPVNRGIEFPDTNRTYTTSIPSMTWGQGLSFSGGTALGGSCEIVMNSDGDFTFSGNLHDSGWDPYNFSIVAVILTPSGIGYTLTQKGHTDGTGSTFPFAPNRDFPWNLSGNNPSIQDNWTQVAQAVCKIDLVAQDITAQTISDLLQQALSQVGIAGATTLLAL
jgi:hypothetical protein